MSSKATTILELAGIALLVAAAVVWAGVAAGMAAAGVSCFVVSFGASRVKRARK